MSQSGLVQSDAAAEPDSNVCRSYQGLSGPGPLGSGLSSVLEDACPDNTTGRKMVSESSCYATAQDWPTERSIFMSARSFPSESNLNSPAVEKQPPQPSSEMVNSRESGRPKAERSFSLLPSKRDLMEMHEVKQSIIMNSLSSNTMRDDKHAFAETAEDNYEVDLGCESTSCFGSLHDVSLHSEHSQTSRPEADAALSPTKSTPVKQPRKGRRGRAQSELPRNTLPVRCVGKSKLSSDFSSLLLTSTLRAHDGPIWCTAFNKDGTFFATGGVDGVLQIWDVSPPPDDRTVPTSPDDDEIWEGKTSVSDESEESVHAPPPTTANSSLPAKGTEIKILASEPRQRFTVHEKDVVDVSWSHTNFLLSASLDHTVRLWHPTKSACLKQFNHTDVVTAVSFHPSDDRYFVSGSFDKKVRIWSIPEGCVKHWDSTPHVITAVEYQPDGELIVVGLFDGKVNFYNVDGRVGLEYHTQINCKNGRSTVGEKVTGFTFLSKLSDDKVEGFVDIKEKEIERAKSRSPQLTRNISVSKFFKKITTGGKKKRRSYKVLITTNDSRVRLVGLNDFRIVRKYVGVENSSLQIKAHISESGEFIACGSDARTCTIWNTATKRDPLRFNVTDFHRYDKVRTYKTFEVTKADPNAVTNTIFVPSKSMRRSIQNSGLFPSLSVQQSFPHDLSSAAIITCDYEGTIRVFIQGAYIDKMTKKLCQR